MPQPESLSEAELDELEALAAAGAQAPFRLEQGKDGRAWVRPTDAAQKALRAVPKLVAAVRRLSREVEALRAEVARLSQPQAKPAGASKAAREADRDRAEDELGTLLSAPFAVSPRAAAAAKSDPLAALAVQVAKALGQDAKDIERARLIAMALAASQGDLERFWEARKKRVAPRPARKA